MFRHSLQFTRSLNSRKFPVPTVCFGTGKLLATTAKRLVLVERSESTSIRVVSASWSRYKPIEASRRASPPPLAASRFGFGWGSISASFTRNHRKRRTSRGRRKRNPPPPSFSGEGLPNVRRVPGYTTRRTKITVHKWSRLHASFCRKMYE